MEVPLQGESESVTTSARHSLEEDSGSVSGESMDGHLQGEIYIYSTSYSI